MKYACVIGAAFLGSGLATAAPSWQVLESFGVGNNVYVRALAFEPATASLWVGTSVGVHEINTKTRDVRHTFTRQAGLANEYVFAITIDPQGHKWFGTNGGGVSRYRDKEWRTFFPMHGLADYWVYSFDTQKDGTVWIGTWAGASRYDPRLGKFTNYVKELVNEWVYGVAVDQQERVWFGTEGGVSMFDGKRWHAWTQQDGVGAPNSAKLPPSQNTGLGTRNRHDLSLLQEGQATYNPGYVFCIHADRQNAIWAGTWGGGVARFDGVRWNNYTVKEGLSGNVVFAITEDAQGRLWFGTDQGISIYDGRRWETLTRKQGLPGDTIYALAATPAGEVWAGTRGAVSLIGATAK